MRKTGFELANWISKKDRFNGFATVTFKQARQFNNGSLVWITRDIVEETCLVIRDRVFKRLKRKFSWVTTIENGNGEKRMHVHMAIAIPDDIAFDDFSMVFLDICGRMDWVHKRVDLRSIADSDQDEDFRKVIFYMFKEGGDALAVNASTFIEFQWGAESIGTYFGGLKKGKLIFVLLFTVV